MFASLVQGPLLRLFSVGLILLALQRTLFADLRPAGVSLQVMLALVEPPYERDDDLQVVERYARRLEAEIRESPADWLWVHNKWKYPKPDAPVQGAGRRADAVRMTAR